MKKTIINPPSTFPPYLHSLAPSLSHILPPALAPSVPPTFYFPSPLPCITSSLPPSIPPLAPSVPPTFYSPSLLPCPSLPACLVPCNSIYTVCVYNVGELHWILCLVRAQPGGVTQPGVALRQWSGRAISRWLAVTLATHPHDESVFDE